MATRTAHPTTRPPGPPELLPGRPDAIVDLQTEDGVALVGGEWRYSDAHVEEVGFVELGSPDDPLGPGSVPNRTYEVLPHAEAADYDDSSWAVLEPADTMRRLADGRVCFNWYRIAVTLPERIGDIAVAGSTVVFEVVIDDYAEVWVNGGLPHALGDTGGHVVGGFNAPNRVVLTHDARPGETFQIAVFGINGPISASPRNYIWLRSASLEIHAPRPEPSDVVATGFEALAAVVVAVLDAVNELGMRPAGSRGPAERRARRHEADPRGARHASVARPSTVLSAALTKGV